MEAERRAGREFKQRIQKRWAEEGGERREWAATLSIAIPGREEQLRGCAAGVEDLTEERPGQNGGRNQIIDKTTSRTARVPPHAMLIYCLFLASVPRRLGSFYGLRGSWGDVAISRRPRGAKPRTPLFGEQSSQPKAGGPDGSRIRCGESLRAFKETEGMDSAGERLGMACLEPASGRRWRDVGAPVTLFVYSVLPPGTWSGLAAARVLPPRQVIRQLPIGAGAATAFDSVTLVESSACTQYRYFFCTFLIRRPKSILYYTRYRYVCMYSFENSRRSPIWGILRLDFA